MQYNGSMGRRAALEGFCAFTLQIMRETCEMGKGFTLSKKIRLSVLVCFHNNFIRKVRKLSAAKRGFKYANQRANLKALFLPTLHRLALSFHSS